jgi:hypothetical protein
MSLSTRLRPIDLNEGDELVRGHGVEFDPLAELAGPVSR